MRELSGGKIAKVFILFCLLVIFFFDIIFLGKTLSTSTLITGVTPNGPYGFSGYKPSLPFSYDIGGNAWINEPNPYIIQDSLSQGTLPIWNPKEGLGMPLIGNLNTEVFNPLKLLLNIHPSPFLQDIYFLLRLFVIGIFTFLFLIEMRLSGIASLFGAILFMLSGYSMWWINLHPLSSIMYIPAFFYFYERWRNTKNTWNLFFLSLMIAFSIFGGKIPDVIMGLSLLFLYASYWGIKDDGLKGLAVGVSKVLMVSISGVLIASPAFLPFLELNSLASPLAKALRTGSASHTLPLLTSISLWQPLFLGWENYLYSSWLKWNPQAMVFYTGIISLIFLIYSIINLKVLKNTLPFNIFFLLLFLQIYGLLPLSDIGNIPVYSSMNFLKYNSMLHFSIAVISAYSLDSLMKNGKMRTGFFISLFVSASVISIYFYFLYNESPNEMKVYLKTLVSLSLFGIAFFGGLYYFLKGSRKFGIIMIVFLVFELLLYMPKAHPDRYHPYVEPEFVKIIKKEHPYRIIGDGNSIPPLVSSAVGLNDIRGMNVLIQGDYYNFFQHLVSFSVPYTNSPDILIASTSSFSDLAGIKYILSTSLIESSKLSERLEANIKSLRWIRLFDSMIYHSIKGGASYGFYQANGEARFSFIFPMNFKLKTRVKVSEPYIFMGFAKDTNRPTKVMVTIEADSREVFIKGDSWHDQWFDISSYLGRTIDIIIESDEKGLGNIFLGNFGLTPGIKEEQSLYESLLDLHTKELDYIEYLGMFDGFYIYKNRNVLERAFVISKFKYSNDLEEVINDLRKGTNFREIGILTDVSEEALLRLKTLKINDKNEAQVIIDKYSPSEVIISVRAEGCGMIVLSDLYHPHWKATVNGKKEDIFKVFGIFKGVIVPDGMSEVRFYYEPMNLYFGICLSILSLIIWGVSLNFRKYFKKKR